MVPAAAFPQPPVRACTECRAARSHAPNGEPVRDSEQRCRCASTGDIPTAAPAAMPGTKREEEVYRGKIETACGTTRFTCHGAVPARHACRQFCRQNSNAVATRLRHAPASPSIFAVSRASVRKSACVSEECCQRRAKKRLSAPPAAAAMSRRASHEPDSSAHATSGYGRKHRSPPALRSEIAGQQKKKDEDLRMPSARIIRSLMRYSARRAAGR